MGWWDVLETGAGAAVGIAEHLGHVAPGVSEFLSAEQALYHAGSATYDAFTGDRDGAINHGVQALYSGVTAIPGIAEMAGAADLAVGVPATAARAGAELGGQDGSYIPGGIGDALGQAAVGATRAVFGEDDSNWIAEGDTPTGTRRGEIVAGTTAMGVGTAMAAGGPVGLFTGLAAAPTSAGLGYGAAELLADDPDGPTSGVGGSPGLVGELVQSGLESVEEGNPGIYDGARDVADDIERRFKPES